MAVSKTPPGAIAAWSGGLRLAGGAAGSGLTTAVALGLASAGGLHLWLKVIDAVKVMSDASAELVVQGLTGLAILLGLYMLVQFGKRQAGSPTTWASWVPVLFFVPVALIAGSVFVLRYQTQQGIIGINFLWIAYGLVFQTFAAAAAAVVWVSGADAAANGQPKGLGTLLDEARRTWLRVSVPHGARVQAVAIGMQVLIPGIYYALQYAFVDMVAVLDPEREKVMERSGKLTWPMRRTLFRVLAIWVIVFELALWGLVLGAGGGELAQEAFFDPRAMPLWLLAAQEIVYAVSLWLVTTTMLFLYRWRIAQVQQRAAERKAAKAAEGTNQPVEG